jgi:chemotaxis signal transduction protein
MTAGIAAGVPGVQAALHIVVRVGDERFAFPVAHVEEALDSPTVEWVPVAPAGMLGQLPHRGRMIGAWDAGEVFRLARQASAGAGLVLRDGDGRVAIIVDDVMEMARIDGAGIRPVPVGADVEGVLSGVTISSQAGTDLVNVVDVDALTAYLASRGTLEEGMAP